MSPFFSIYTISHLNKLSGGRRGRVEAERVAGYDRLRLARADYVHLRCGAARLARRSGLTSNQSLLPANVSCCHTKGASFRSSGEMGQGGSEWRPTKTGSAPTTAHAPWNRGHGPERGFPRRDPHLSSANFLNRQPSWTRVSGIRVVCGKHYP